MKWYKKILAVMSFCTVLTTVNCFAATNTDTIFNDDNTNCYKIYEVAEEEKDTFENMIEKEIYIDNSKYIFKKFTSTGGNIEKTIDINTTKTIKMKTNNMNSIIEQLEKTMKYEKDGYIGTYNLNTDAIQIKTNYNGYYEQLIEENIQYKDLSRNDLDFIPKEIKKDGLTLVLLTTNWEPQNYINIGENEVPNLYTANCYYATKQRINYPNTYTITAEYLGKATKIEKNPIIYKVEYEKEVVEEPIDQEEKENNILPIIGGSTGIILVIIFFVTGNVTVYNYKEGQWIKVGKTRIIKDKINLNRFALFEKTNRYKLQLSKNLTKKKKGKLITVSKNRNSLKLLVNSTEVKPYTFEVRL